MRTFGLMLVAATILSSAACSAEKAAEAKNVPEVTVASVPAPNNGDWSAVVAKTREGGFIMGNPNAKVKLVEFGSMTCGHCAAFEEEGGKTLVDNYVKKGLVSWEFRNFVKDPFDMTAALLARCGGEASFFGLTRTLFHEQRSWVGKIQAADPAKLQALQTMSTAQQFSTIADLGGLKAFAAQRGVPRARAEQCLANEQEANQLVQMNSDAISTYSVRGTPNFVINGAGPAESATWETLEPKIKEAIAS
jgi:protein-disulfide isomerase